MIRASLDRCAPVQPGLRAVSRPRQGVMRALVLGASCVLALVGCANSKLIIGPLYDRIDDRMFKWAREWVEFTPTQSDEFAALIGTAHTWHRRIQLPRHAALIREMTSTLETWGQVTQDDFHRWFDRLEANIGALRTCHPAKFSAGLARTLSDIQVGSIRARRVELEAERTERRGQRTRSERIERRVGNIDKWTGRIGLALDDVQLALLTETFGRQTSLNREYRELSDAWHETLFSLLDDRAAPDFADRFRRHTAEWFTMLQTAHPEAVRNNRRIWRDFAIRFEKTLSKLQRRDALRWLDKFADTLDAISRDEPDYLPANDPAYGCTIDG